MRDVEPFRLKPWARVYRARAGDRVVWLKVPEAAFRFEARVLELLRPLAPDLLPTALAADTERGWLLLADEGEEREPDWEDVLPRYARLQREATPLADELVAAGVDDYRGGLLAAAVERLVPGNTRAQDFCERLETSAIPPTLEHRDLHHGNIRGRVLLDWGDMAVAHPLLSLACDDIWGESEAYLASWPDEPEAVEAARGLRKLWHALSWQRVLPYDPSWQAQIDRLVAAF